MTSQVAITLLKSLEQSLDSYCGLNDEGKTAFSMAISALNCSEFPNNSDTISRQAAIDAVDKRFDGIPMEQTQEILLLRRDLRTLPSVKPRKGKWIGYNADDKDWQRDDGSPVFMNCSECHEAVINNGSAHWNFCPNCGCRMREGDAE